ncbi:Nucleolar GTP-binding protein 1 [Capsicum chinense]|nr:Nucleolar GTP-binding protein 1 [Capsicum chinense]
MEISRSMSRPQNEFVPREGYKDKPLKERDIKMFKKSSNKRNKDTRQGKADRVIPTLKSKHLFSGKRTSGKTDK